MSVLPLSAAVLNSTGSRSKVSMVLLTPLDAGAVSMVLVTPMSAAGAAAAGSSTRWRTATCAGPRVGPWGALLRAVKTPKQSTTLHKSPEVSTTSSVRNPEEPYSQ